MKNAVLALLVLWIAPAVYAREVRHPLDPLSWKEHRAVLEVLRDAGHFDAETRFSRVNLIEPDKALVWAWSGVENYPRSAFALVRQGPRAFEAVVGVKERALTSWKELTDVQPNWLGEEFGAMTDVIVAWYTFGMHHMVRAEDWPVMPVLWHSFEIRPFDFFHHNPAMDLPR